MELFRREPKPGRQFDEDALKKAQAAVRQEEAAKRLSGEKLHVAAEGRQSMSDQESEPGSHKSEKEQEQERPLGPTEELLAEDRAEATIKDQQPEKEDLSHQRTAEKEREEQQSQQREPEPIAREAGKEQPGLQGQREREDQERRTQEEQEHRSAQEREEQERKEAEAKQHEQSQAEQQQRVRDAVGKKSQSQEQQVLGYTITMDGLYIVPKYQPYKRSLLGQAYDYVTDKLEASREQKPQEQQEGREEKQEKDSLSDQHASKQEAGQQKAIAQHEKESAQTLAKEPDKENQSKEAGQEKGNTIRYLSREEVKQRIAEKEREKGRSRAKDRDRGRDMDR